MHVQANLADEAGRKAHAALAQLPPHYRRFYTERLVSRLQRELLGED